MYYHRVNDSFDASYLLLTTKPWQELIPGGRFLSLHVTYYTVRIQLRAPPKNESGGK